MQKLNWLPQFFLLLLVAGAGTGYAQHSGSTEPLIAGFAEFPPYMQMDENGTRSGFIVDLAEAIGEELGIRIRYQDSDNARAFIGAQVSGASQFIPGIAPLPPLRDTNLFSDPVATEQQRLLVLTERVEEFSREAVTGKKIAVVPPAVGSEIESLLSRNTVVEFPSPDAAIMQLLTGRVDAVLSPNPTAFVIARQAGVDHRIGFINTPVGQFPRVVALHQSRAALLPAINEAIAKMQADGRLARLQAKYFLELPKSVPDVLTVGIAHSPPYGILGSDGTVSGFAVDVIRDLAELTGLEIVFQPMTLDAYFDAIDQPVPDVLPYVLVSPELQQMKDASLPITSSPIALFTRSGDAATSLQEINGRPVAMKEDTVSAAVSAGVPEGTITIINDDAALVQALADGAVDAILDTPNPMRTAIAAGGHTGSLHQVGPPIFSINGAIGLRFGLGVTREQLNAAIPGYVLSDRFSELEAKYFGEPLYWTETRIYSAAGGIALAFAALLGSLIWQRHRLQLREYARQARELEKEQEHSKELEQLISDLELANQEQAEFTYAISHDLKSPNNTIAMLIEALEEDGAVHGDGKRLLSSMKETNHRMGRLVEDVLDYSRIVDEDMQTEQIDCNALVNGVIDDLASAIANAGADVACENLPALKGHPMQIRILFQNLISNAVKFRSPDRSPVVRISARTTPDAVIFQVSDNGIGIPEAHRERVFGLFQRLHSQSEYAGTGMGLTICRRVMQNHGGHISVRPGQDSGTAFELVFKRH